MTQMPHSAGTAVVTGAAGFIGSHLTVHLLRKGWRVVGVDNFSPTETRAEKSANVDRIASVSGSAFVDRFELIECDIRGESELHRVFDRERPDAVFHFAARTGVRASIESPAEYVSVNVDGLVSTLEAARASGCRHVVFASSSSVYGDSTRVPFVEDDSVDRPISPYAATKRAGELICSTYASAYAMRIAAVRLFTVYGPAQRSDLAIARFMKLIAAGEEVLMYGDGSSARDYTYINDIVIGVVAAFDRVAGLPLPGTVGESAGGGYFRIWNLGNSRPIALADMIAAVSRVVGRRARVKPMPIQPGDVVRTWADLTHSAAELGFCPSVEFDDGLSRQWAWAQLADRFRVTVDPLVDRDVPMSAI